MSEVTRVLPIVNVGPITLYVVAAPASNGDRGLVTVHGSFMAIEVLGALRDRSIAGVWIDAELQGRDTAWPVVEWLVEEALSWKPLAIKAIQVRGCDPQTVAQMHAALSAAGYAVTARVFDGPALPSAPRPRRRFLRA